ncbi:MAG: acyltransferase family protein, partial [Clostridia bacterium]|nr:acyltransferase family protein [Clostridia bacterium]
MIRRDYSLGISREESNIISVIRVFAMFLIVLCHISYTYGKFAFIGQVFNVGVDVFFIVSGFIYGQKQIECTYKWVKNR